jgi:hypothetical protein
MRIWPVGCEKVEHWGLIKECEKLKSNQMEMNKEEYNWTDEPVVGMALLITGGSIDSFGEQIEGNVYYEVGKHKTDGMVVIVPTDRNQKHGFAKEKVYNHLMKRANRFN